jgi:enoyl-CoA hydratase
MSGWQGSSGSIVGELDDGVATITLNRPEKLNALSETMLEDIAAAVRFFDAETDALGIVITGAGRAFTAGQDLDAAVAHSTGDVDRVIDRYNDITRAILGTSIPVAAAFNGIAVGGGAEMTLSCDARIAGTRGEFFLPENARGLAISNATSYLLPRLIGSRALPLVIGSRRLGAEEALRIGLFDQVVADDRLLDVASEQMRQWGAPGSATAEHLRVMRPQLAEVEAAMKREVAAARDAALSGATTRGVQAFLDRDRAS